MKELIEALRQLPDEKVREFYFVLIGANMVNKNIKQEDKNEFANYQTARCIGQGF